MEAAERHRQPGFDELTRQIDGAGKLIGLHADEADQGAAAGALDVGDDAVDADARVGLVDRPGDDVDIRSQHLALAAVFSQPVERSQGIGGNVRPQPSDRIAVVVVMRGLDQHQLEGRSLRRGGHESAFWLLRGQSRRLKGVVKRRLDGAVEVSASVGIYGESPSRRHLCESRSGAHASLYHIEHHAASATAWLTSRLAAAARNVATALSTTEDRAL